MYRKKTSIQQHATTVLLLYCGCTAVEAGTTRTSEATLRPLGRVVTCVSGQLSTYDGKSDAFGNGACCCWAAEKRRAAAAAAVALAAVVVAVALAAVPLDPRGDICCNKLWSAPVE